ncbi:MAG: hypothetical protein E7170_03980 [Firmicutes bacterium]|nr:hypothetical protein [Bacillota bacterium]
MNLFKINNNEKIKIDEFRFCILIFMFCGVFGFFVEEIYDTLYNLKIDKNGFLYGLFLPIYGWGGIVIHLISKKTKSNPLLTFIIIALFAAIFEYLSGYIIFKIWGKMYWNYSNYYLNLNGYICLFSVLAFTLLGIFYVYIIEPIIKFIVNKIDEKRIDLYIKIFLIIYLIDNIFSFLVKNKF